VIANPYLPLGKYFFWCWIIGASECTGSFLCRRAPNWGRFFCIVKSWILKDNEEKLFAICDQRRKGLITGWNNCIAEFDILFSKIFFLFSVKAVF